MQFSRWQIEGVATVEPQNTLVCVKPLLCVLPVVQPVAEVDHGSDKRATTTTRTDSQRDPCLRFRTEEALIVWTTLWHRVSQSCGVTKAEFFPRGFVQVRHYSATVTAPVWLSLSVFLSVGMTLAFNHPPALYCLFFVCFQIYVKNFYC